MTEQRSFVASDFSLRDVPGFLIVYVIVSAMCVVAGLTLEALPKFWGGVVCGIGIGFLGALALLRSKREIDTSSLPEPSAAVRSKLEEPNSKLAEAVKMYCDETGLGLSEGTAVLRAYVAEQKLSD